jgi:hypothetical protein
MGQNYLPSKKDSASSRRKERIPSEATLAICFVRQSFNAGGIMRQGNKNPTVIDYAGTGEKQSWNAIKDDGPTARADQAEPAALVELVVIEGPEGQKMHAMQAEVIHRILARLAQRQVQTSEKESRL